MILLLHLLVLLPLSGALVCIFISKTKEKTISFIGQVTVGLHLLGAIVFVINWAANSFERIDVKDFVLFKSDGYEFFIDFCFDKVTAVYLLVGAFLTFLITVYCRYYLHREAGYKRFFTTILFFYVGYTIVIFSGNLETLFVGWEVLGIASFLLIAFYRHRYLPVKNALKIYSVYRIGDTGLILAMWLTHHLWHKNITFFTLQNIALVNNHLETHNVVGAGISLMILISAAAKSAQLPFSSWLPRAMEGPTPSSAIFYGSLSVHLGVFLLLRTFPFWEHQLSIRILIGVLGLVTCVMATGIARVQSSIKSQIAYSSIAQIGMMFIEIAFGLETLVLIHFAGNAFLRTYQLLVSPSVVTYLIREQFYNFKPRKETLEDSLPKRLQYTFYMLSLKEWNLDFFIYTYLWSPFKKVKHHLSFFQTKHLFIFFMPVLLVGIFIMKFQSIVSISVLTALPLVFSIIGLLLVLRSFVERHNALQSWLLIIINHFCVALAVSFNENFSFYEVLIYIAGIVLAGAGGALCLLRLKRHEPEVNLKGLQGYIQLYPRLGIVFLVCCLGVTGFPISPTFIGEDLIFSHVHEGQALLAAFISLSFILDGLAIIRIYARLFLGPYKQGDVTTAIRSA